MEQISAVFKNWHRSKPTLSGWIPVGTMLAVTAFATLCQPPRARAFDAHLFLSAGQPAGFWQTFEPHATLQWGHDSTWRQGYHLPGRHGAGRDNGRAPELEARGIEAAPGPVFGDEPRCDIVIVRLCKALPHRLPGESKRPDAGTALRHGATPGIEPGGAKLTLMEKFRVYLVQRGDSLWKIARRFDMNHRALATVNGLNTGAILQVGRPLKVKTAASRELRLNLTSSDLASHPSLLEHIRMIDGRPAPRWLVTDYVAGVIDKRPPGAVNKGWEGRMKNLTIVIHFQLVKNLLEGRARKYHPMVLAHAQKYNLDPALIMAMIHTESEFNPEARSQASAYGLMQLVPHTAGQEAYHRIYGQRRKLTPQYLFDPNNNIELGTAYLHILKKGYLGAITDPLSRTYCAVAAYNAGPSNVWKAFTPRPSLKEAILTINSLTPADVYQRLVEALPSIESRNYLRDVIKRVSLYSSGYGKSGATST